MLVSSFIIANKINKEDGDVDERVKLGKVSKNAERDVMIPFYTSLTASVGPCGVSKYNNYTPTIRQGVHRIWEGMQLACRHRSRHNKRPKGQSVVCYTCSLIPRGVCSLYTHPAVAKLKTGLVGVVPNWAMSSAAATAPFFS